MNTIAKEIANKLNTKHGITWVTPALVQGVIVISKPLRKILLQFLREHLAEFHVKKAEVVAQIKRGDTLANSINALRIVMAGVLLPVDNLMKMLPLDTILKELLDSSEVISVDNLEKPEENLSFDQAMNFIGRISEELAKLLSSVINFIPVKIPPLDAISNIVSIDPDYFEGVNSYQDLKEKIDELTFRLARATALGTYAGAGSAYIDNQIRELNIYIDLIESVDIGDVI